ncbi:MAG: CYTH domain-containing protein [Prevotella sp.]|nr:CYTH domain-containing protein [Prevotella sp.]MCI7496969.1 CYTH domain-containing protein [Prevotella sp.]MDD6994026.1 CYTH domain-containing protein [Prevotella sp.]MDD7509114.1 CYTH domain-containing protein [Prevotella sp.]MDY2806641.1 CYTH domain-containing protein [Prevotella sp.]
MHGIMQEIERKFLVRKDGSYKAMASSHSHIRQGYMACKGATVRIRLRDDKAYLTIKGPSRNGGMSRFEFEREILVEEADEMFKLCVGGVIDKTRWIVPYEGHIFEVDEFHGINDGLLFAEVELKTEDEHFEKPPFLGPEVTGNRHFYNSHLLVNPYPQWRETVPEEYR